MWALLRALERCDAADIDSKAPPTSTTVNPVNPVNRASAQYTAAIRFGRSGRFFDRHGLQPAASACRSLLRKCGARPPALRARARVPEPFLAAAVTEREMEVLAVLSDGLCNKDIAARLYLSPKTVEKHVASLLDKLEVRSRTALAAIAAGKMGDAALADWGKSRMLRVAPAAMLGVCPLQLQRFLKLPSISPRFISVLAWPRESLWPA
jgi:DNA-binding CsgD family transcriptional regulator